MNFLAVMWGISNGLLPENTIRYTENLKKKAGCIGTGDIKWEQRRPDLRLEDSGKKAILLVNMACPRRVCKRKIRKNVKSTSSFVLSYEKEN